MCVRFVARFYHADINMLLFFNSAEFFYLHKTANNAGNHDYLHKTLKEKNKSKEIQNPPS